MVNVVFNTRVIQTAPTDTILGLKGEKLCLTYYNKIELLVIFLFSLSITNGKIKEVGWSLLCE